MDPLSSRFTNKDANRGAWTAEEDKKLAQVIEIHGPKRWKKVAAKAVIVLLEDEFHIVVGLNRCGKSCRLRWMNYLRPNIKRGNISDQEEDLILRLHKLLGNRWSLIAGRLPGRTDNEIKNYWNSHLSKKKKEKGRQNRGCIVQSQPEEAKAMEMDNIVNKSEEGTSNSKAEENSKATFNEGDFCYSSIEGPLDLEWMGKFLEMDESWFEFLYDK